MLPLRRTSLHTKADSPEQPEESDHDTVQYHIRRPLNILPQLLCAPIYAETCAQNTEPQCRIVVVDVGDTSHEDEWEVVQEPANSRVNSRVVDVFNLVVCKIGVAALPANDVEGN